MNYMKLRGLSIEPLANGDKWIATDDEYYDVYLNHADKLAYINNMAVEYSSISRYTGLKDKTGKDIYEGDIVEERWENPLAGGVNVCRYEIDVSRDGLYKMYHLSGEERWKRTLFLRYQHTEVIGNIHENPKLLEESE